MISRQTPEDNKPSLDIRQMKTSLLLQMITPEDEVTYFDWGVPIYLLKAVTELLLERVIGYELQPKDLEQDC